MTRQPPLLFAPQAGRELGEQVSLALGYSLAGLEERQFDDGEHNIRPLVSVRERNIFVIQSLYDDHEQSVNDRLVRLLFFLNALRDAAAGRVTAVVPYLCYSRKDRQTQARDPVTTRYVAQLFESAGVDCVVTMDVHNLAAFQNSFRCRTEHLEGTGLFVQHFVPLLRGEAPVAVSPDTGGMKRVRRFADALARALDQPVPTAILEKQRMNRHVTGDLFAGDVAGKTAIILDDLISSGTTLVRAANACRERGAARIFAAATHGLFVQDAERILSDSAIERIVVTDTIPPFRLSRSFLDERVAVLTASALIADAIRHLHEGNDLDR